MRVLVTGAAGFIGSHVAETMRAAGHDVRVDGQVGQVYAEPDHGRLVADRVDPGQGLVHRGGVADIADHQFAADVVRPAVVHGGG